MNLTELAIKHCTDKAIHGYTEFYSRYMEPVRESTTKVVEFGVGLGGSTRLWLEYFPNAHLYVIDNDPKAIATIQDSLPGGRLTIIKANQTDPVVWDIIGDNIDFVIDDASHRPEHQIETFGLGMKHIKPGRWYIIEDTQCSFVPQFSTNCDMLYPWLEELIVEQQVFALGDHDFYTARATNPDNMKSLASLIYSYHCYKSVIMFERAND